MANVGLACGPTGGHLLPASLVGKALQDRGAAVVLFTDFKQSLQDLVQHNLPVTTVKVNPWANQSLAGKLKSLSSLLNEYLRLRHRVRSLDVLISFGGYTTVPLLLAAWETGVPIYIQEQNRVLGRANRLFAGYAQLIFQGLPLSEDMEKEVMLTGNPVRPPGLPDDDWFKKSPLLVVLGGSQGSRNVSRFLSESAPELLDQGWAIYYVKGNFGLNLNEKNWSTTEQFRQVELDPYLNEILPSAQVIWSRAGAGTIAEIIKYNRPALLFPLRDSADNHQGLNARWLSRRGPTSVVKTEQEAVPNQLISRTEKLLEMNTNYEIPWEPDENAQDLIARSVLARIP